MLTALMIFHAVISVLLIIMVLLQFGKGAEAGLLSGGGGGESLMSTSQRGNVLSKITVVLAVLFLGNSILLAKLQTTTSSSSIMDAEAPVSRPLNSDQAAGQNKGQKAPVKAKEENKASQGTPSQGQK